MRPELKEVRESQKLPLIETIEKRVLNVLIRGGDQACAR